MIESTSYLKALLTKLCDKESQYLIKSDLKNIFIARFFSLLTLYVVIFISALAINCMIFAFSFNIQFLLFKAINVYQINYNVSGLIGLTLFLPVLFNFFNREFNYSRSVFRIIQTIYRSKPHFSGKFLFEVFIFMLYIYLSSMLTVSSFTSLTSQKTMESLLYNINPRNLNQVSSGLVISLAIFYAAVYLTVRIILAPAKSHENSLNNHKRKFLTWVIALITTVIYIFFKCMLTPVSWYDGFYFVFVLIITFDRVVNSYQAIIKFDEG